MWEQSPDIEWIAPYEGYEYRPQTDSEQDRALSVCGIDPADFGDVADPSFFIGLAIHAGVESGITADGNVNMVQHLVQHAPLRLDTDIPATGTVLRVEEVPRGQAVTSEV